MREYLPPGPPPLPRQGPKECRKYNHVNEGTCLGKKFGFFNLLFQVPGKGYTLKNKPKKEALILSWLRPPLRPRPLSRKF